MVSLWEKFEELIKQEMRKTYSEAVVGRNCQGCGDSNPCRRRKELLTHDSPFVRHHWMLTFWREAMMRR